MPGIAGWFSTGPGRGGADVTADRMAAFIGDPADARSVILPAGHALIVSGSMSDLAADDTTGVVAAITGKPRWRDESLADLATARGDASALLHAYRNQGDELFGNLTGAFAIAIIDRDRIMISVDRMGLRSMCYGVAPRGGIVFGSNIDAIMAHGLMEPEISHQSLYRYVYFHVIPSPETIYARVFKLEPAQLVSCAGSTPEARHYWTPQFNTSRRCDPRSLQAELMSNLRASIARAAPDRNTAAFLSGGLDSSTVCGLANEVNEEPISAYSIGFSQEGYDEIEYARIAAKHFGLDLREYYVTPVDVAEAMPVIANAYDEPFGNSSAVPVYFCAVRARDDGVSRLLAGDGGDELFAGNERYTKQQVFEHYARVPRWLRRSVVEPLAVKLPSDFSVLTQKARRYIEQARVPMPERLQTYNYLHMNSPDAVFNADFLSQIETHGPIDDMDKWYQRGADADFVDRMLLFDWKLTLADNDIRKVNRMCGEAGVDVDYPLLDDELVGFSTQIPVGLKLHNNELRYFFKQATADFLPSPIIHKEKHGFGLPFGEWLKTSDRLMEVVMPSLKRLRDGAIFRHDFIDQLQRNHQEVHAALYGNMIWVLVMLDMWLEARSGSSGVVKG